MLDLEVKMMNKFIKIKEGFVEKISDERGDTNIISVIIILVIVVALAGVFRKNIAALAGGTWNSVFSEAATATNNAVNGTPAATFQ